MYLLNHKMRKQQQFNGIPTFENHHHHHHQQQQQKVSSLSRQSFARSKTIKFYLAVIVIGVISYHRVSRTSVLRLSPSSSSSESTSVTNEEPVPSLSRIIIPPPPPPPPPQCTDKEFDIIQNYQLPIDHCNQTFTQPWMNKCSFSYATRCPDSIWLSDQYTSTRINPVISTTTGGSSSSSSGSSSSGSSTTKTTTSGNTIQTNQPKSSSTITTKTTTTTTRIAIYVGCNKAMDAINTLRMLSQNATYDRDVWRTTLLSGSSNTNTNTTTTTTNSSTINHEPGRCGQEFTEQFPLLSKEEEETLMVSNNNYNTIVHCIEAMPVTAQHLQRTAELLQWTSSSSSHHQQQQHRSSQLLIHNVAMSNVDGTILFPNLKDTIGVENQGIEQCQYSDSHNNPNCVSVPLYRLDTFMSQFMTLKPPVSETSSVLLLSDQVPLQLIDFISIDVEGYDYEVLLGAPLILQRTKYIEFEYNWKGNWNQHLLSDVIDTLQTSAGFVCYWAGTYGHIWRITNCWMDHYNLHFWSNIACVNVRNAPQLYNRMEEMFQTTIRAGDKIQYHKMNTANTDGGYH